MTKGFKCLYKKGRTGQTKTQRGSSLTKLLAIFGSKGRVQKEKEELKQYNIKGDYLSYHDNLSQKIYYH
jgi:hypothetical protein